MGARRVVADVSNAALLERLAQDLDGNFETLVVNEQDGLYVLALRLTASPRDAEEIAQESLVRAYRALKTYPPARIRELAVRPWLYRIALNVAKNRFRGKRVQTIPLDLFEDGVTKNAIAHDDSRPDFAVERSENSAELAALVARLPDRFREAVVLRYVQDLGYAEASAVLGQPVGTVKSNVHRGLRMLREALACGADGVARMPSHTSVGEKI